MLNAPTSGRYDGVVQGRALCEDETRQRRVSSRALVGTRNAYPASKTLGPRFEYDMPLMQSLRGLVPYLQSIEPSVGSVPWVVRYLQCRACVVKCAFLGA